MSIAENIKTLRKARSLNQIDLAEMLGVSDKTVSSWEIGRTEPKMGMIEKISAALNCKKSEIIGSDATMINIQYNDEESYARYFQNTLAYHLEGQEELTEEEKAQVEEYIQFILSKRK